MKHSATLRFRFTQENIAASIVLLLLALFLLASLGGMAYVIIKYFKTPVVGGTLGAMAYDKVIRPMQRKTAARINKQIFGR